MTNTQHSHPELDALYGGEAPLYTADGGVTFPAWIAEHELPVWSLWNPGVGHVHGEWYTDVAPSGVVRYVCGSCGYRPPVQ